MPTEVSRNQYLKTYEYLVNKAETHNLNSLLQFVKATDVSLNTKRNYLNSIICIKSLYPDMLSYTEKTFKKLVQYRDELSDQIRALIDKGQVNENQKKALSNVSLSDLNDFVNELKYQYQQNNTLKHLEDYLLVDMMVTYPVRNDLADIIITSKKSEDKDHNYLWCMSNNSCTLVINKHKTANHRGPITIKINPRISQLINALIKKDPNRKYLFHDNNDQPYTSASFYAKLSTLFNRRFGIKISSTLLRKIIDSGKFGKISKEEKEMAEVQGHSLETQRRIYTSTQPWVKRD